MDIAKDTFMVMEIGTKKNNFSTSILNHDK